MNFIIDCHIPFIKGVFESVGHKCSYLPPEAINAEVCREANVLIIRTRTRCDARLLERSKVSAIATATIGYDHIDIDYCRKHGIRVFSCPGCNAEAVRQWVFAAIDTWSAIRHTDISTITLGIVGVGHVGSAVAKHAMERGIKTLCCDPPLMRENPLLNYTELKEVAEQADILTMHTPLTFEGPDATYHLCGKEFLDIFATHGGLIINAARGGVLDEKQAKEHKNIDYAIDCWEGEPNIDTMFMNAAIIATPHIAGYSIEGKANATTMVVRQISQQFGLGLNQWTAQYGKPSKNLTYNILEDDNALRNAPTEFEQLRSTYKLR